MKRRALLAGLGGTIAATAVLGGARAQQVGILAPDTAPFAPWTELADFKPGDPHGLIAAAILASSPHNTQPWLFRLGDHTIEIIADTARHLGSFDPFRREMWLGLGASAENLSIAAPGLGFKLGNPRLLGLGEQGTGRLEMDMAPTNPEPHPLAVMLAQRRTNRASYAIQSIQGELKAALQAESIGKAQVILIDRAQPQGDAFRIATIKATAAINADKQMGKDGHCWFRPNARAIAHHRDGVSIATAGLSPLTTLMGQMLPETDVETAGGYWLESTKRVLNASAGFGLIVVEDLYDREGQIDAGRLWQRLQLAMTKLGIASQPMNQLPEMVDRDRQLGRDDGWADHLSDISQDRGRVTFAFRYGTPLVEVPQSARRPIKTVLTTS